MPTQEKATPDSTADDTKQSTAATDEATDDDNDTSSGAPAVDGDTSSSADVIDASASATPAASRGRGGGGERKSSSSSRRAKMNVVIDAGYHCQYCGQTFDSYFKLKTHMLVHKDQMVRESVLMSLVVGVLHHLHTHVHVLYMCIWPSLAELMYVY